MSLLDFDDTYRKPFSPSKSQLLRAGDARRGDNFEELQNLDHKKVSEDYEDSPHADRQPLPADS